MGSDKLHPTSCSAWRASLNTCSNNASTSDWIVANNNFLSTRCISQKARTYNQTINFKYKQQFIGVDYGH